MAWSGDIGPEQVVPLRYFGRDLVAYRGKDGVVRVHDRHCRHLGASLAHGGCVVDDGIQCPFHGWVWAPDGHNVSIPYQDRPNRARLLGTWPADRAQRVGLRVVRPLRARRRCGTCLTYCTAPRTPPDASSIPAWPDGRQHYRDLQVHPQMVVENVVDPHHFRFVHHTEITPVVLQERVEGHEWWARVGFGRGWRDHARDASGAVRTDTRNTIEILWSGMGVSVNVEHMGEGVRVITINITPVEDGRTEIFATYWIDRVAGDLDDGSYQRRLDEAKLALPDDIAIWNNQIFLDPPVLATEEGSGFRRIRRWARQFYPGDSAGNAPTGTDDTRSPTVGKLETDAS